MKPTGNVRRIVLAILALAGAMVLMLGTAPAFANGQHAHTSGDAVTEDNDSDGQPNMPDPAGDTDNRHPSGKDRSEEHGKSGNQGDAESTPDQDSRGPDRDNGGTDKPDGPGGADILDQDRNNGCGNDDDFDDDSEGWCGGKPEVGGEEEENPPENGEEGGEVGGVDVTKPTTKVLGEQFERPPAAVLGAELSRTGALIAPLLLAGFALVGAGGIARKRSRS